MSEPGWTKGPWKVRSQKYDDWGIVRSADGNVVALAREGRFVPEDEYAKHRKDKTDPCAANAHLIAAAPCLHDALTDILRMLEAAYMQLGMGTADNKRIVKARTALSRARGEQSNG